MKKMVTLLAAISLLLLMLAGCAAAKEKRQKPVSRDDRISYGIGVEMGKNFRNQGVPINPDYLAQGLRDSQAGVPSLLTDEEFKEAMMALRQELEAKQKARLDELGRKNQEDNAVFFADNGKKKGVVTLPSGLQYQVLLEGTGKKPGPEDTVTVHYTGTLLNGQEFDSSHKRGQPATFPVGGVISGWVEGLQLMKEGGKMKLFIPPKLGYGENGAGPMIGPHAALIFEVELLKIEPPVKQ